MQSEQDAEFVIEKKHLEDTLNSLDEKIRELKSMSISGATEFSARKLEEKHKERVRNYEESQGEPYFGRIDISENDYLKETHYIGYIALGLGNSEVIDWRSPIGGLFYVGGQGTNEVRVPDGVRKIKLLLKRNIEIRQGKLVKIFDSFRHSSQIERREDIQEEDFLLETLSARSSAKLEDIVRTIQIEQDKIIRSKSDGILVINGVPGSGKTSVAYHRLAYMLFEAENSNSVTRNITFIGPTSLFLSYAKDLLPTLRVRNVPQLVFWDWALRLLGRKDNKVIDSSWNAFISPSSNLGSQRNNWKRALLKNELRLSSLLDAYIEYRYSSLVAPFRGITISNIKAFRAEFDIITGRHDELTIRIPPYQLEEMFAKHKDLSKPFNHFRKTLNLALDKIVEEHYAGAIKNQLSADKRERANLKINFRQGVWEAKKEARRLLDIACPEIDPVLDYHYLMQNHSLLVRFGERVYSNDELTQLMELDAYRKDDHIDVLDLAGILYLHLRANGTQLIHFDHLVVDEGQDYSPLMYKVFSMVSDSMTIVGDVNQGIFRYRGTTDWEDLKKVFGEKMSIQFLETNYRSAHPIVSFSNAILSKTKSGKSKFSKPVERNGELPSIVVCEDLSEMYSSIAFEIDEVLQNEQIAIGVLAKSDDGAEELHTEITRRSKNRSIINLVTSSKNAGDYRGGVLITTIAMAKGMEFDLVIVANGSEPNYSSEIGFNRDLLYVAATRALHSLIIYSVGELSQHLQVDDQLVMKREPRRAFAG